MKLVYSLGCFSGNDGICSIIRYEPEMGFRQFYLLLHHIGFYFYGMSTTKFTESFYSDCPFYFYFVIFLFVMSLMGFACTCEDPGYVETEPEDTTNLFLCTVCERHCPPRASHCRKCGKCVMRRDHHCPWTAICVGRDNHAFFLSWVFCELTLSICLLVDIIASMCKSRNDGLPMSDWMTLHFIGLLFIPWCLIGIFMFGTLSVTHFLMAINNVTTWEMMMRDKISYMKVVPMHVHPYDRGILQNLSEFMTMRYVHKEWSVPQPPSLDQMMAERNVVADILGVDGSSLELSWKSPSVS